jgi:hypothetical protein
MHRIVGALMSAGLFRIVKPSSVRATSASVAAEDTRSRVGNEVERLAGKAVKLIPGEIIGLHASLTSLWIGDRPWPVPGQGGMAEIILEWLLPIFGLFATVYIRLRGSRRAGTGWEDTQWPVGLLAGGSYVGWLLSTGHPIFSQTFDPRLGGTLLLFMAILPTIFYQGVDQ